jgi:HK97 family phage major capsid protein
MSNVPPVKPAENPAESRAVNLILEQLKDTVTKEVSGGLEPILTTIKAIEQRQKEHEEKIEGTQAKQSTKIDAMIDEARDRMARGGYIDNGTGFRQNAFGQVAPALSRELTDFVGAVFSNGRQGDLEAIEKAQDVRNKQLRELGSTVPSDGGYLIPPDRVPELLQLITLYGQGRKNVFTVPMKGPSRKYPTLESAVDVYWAEENPSDDFTESEPTFGEIELNAKTLVGMTHVSQQLVDDADPEIFGILVDLFTRAFARKEDDEIFNGTGSGAYAFTGIMNTPGTNVVAMQGANETSFSLINADYLLDMQTETPTPALNGAKYYLHRSIFDYVRKLKDGVGQYIWQPPTNGAPGTIHGYPYELVEVMPSRSASGAAKPFVVFGNLRYVYLGDRKTLVTDRNDRGPGYKRLQIYLRMYERIAIKVIASLTGNSPLTKLVTHA